MTHGSESPMEATVHNFLLTRAITNIGTWNIRTMFETGKTAQVSAEMRRYNIAVLGLCETRWTQSVRIRLSTGETLLYSGHEEDNSPHTEGMGLMLSAEAAGSFIEWTPVSSRIVIARFRSRTRNVQIVQCYAPTNDADGDLKTDFYEQLQATLEQRTKRDILIVMGDFNAKIGSDNDATTRDKFKVELSNRFQALSTLSEEAESAEEILEESKAVWKKACDVREKKAALNTLKPELKRRRGKPSIQRSTTQLRKVQEGTSETS
ncbi:hypothetical protein ACROYT_G005285 [Oculina patagonica]